LVGWLVDQAVCLLVLLFCLLATQFQAC
jgi:hypothetical protein